MLDGVREEMRRDAAQAATHFGAATPDAVEDDATLLVDVWVFDPTYRRTLLVRHRRRGWVMPGGKVEPNERPRDAAVRELYEETGLRCDRATLEPAASHYVVDPDGTVIWAMSYATVIDDTSALEGEPDQEPRWWDLAEHWTSAYPHDRGRLLEHARSRARDVPGPA